MILAGAILYPGGSGGIYALPFAAHPGAWKFSVNGEKLIEADGYRLLGRRADFNFERNYERAGSFY